LEGHGVQVEEVRVPTVTVRANNTQAVTIALEVKAPAESRNSFEIIYVEAFALALNTNRH